MISKETLLHIPKSNYAYGYDLETLHIRMRLKKNDAKKVTLIIGDPYIWEKGGADGGNLNAKGASGWTGGQSIEMTKEVETEFHDYWSVMYRPEKKRSRYAFLIEDEDEKILFGERQIVTLTKKNTYRLHELANFFCFPYLNNVDVHKIPKWVKDTVWYQIFPDRFSNGDASTDTDQVEPWGTRPKHHNFMGGDLQGIINHLDYLKDLGINGIYLCPIFKANSNHRYDTIDYMAIDEMLGNKETFKLLVHQAHAKGIRIMIDAVFNHMGYLSKEWLDVVKHHEASRYKDWFYIHEFPVYDRPFDQLDGRDLNYETFGRVKYMPKVNTENPEVIDYFMKVGKYWVETFGVDAWRIDVANEVDHRFWRTFRKTILDVNPEVFLLGEIWHDAQPWVQGDQFDVAMNYPLTEAIIHFFCTDDIDKEAFIHAVNKVKVSYTLQVTENNFNLLDSHDTSRILSIANNDDRRIKLAYLFMMTQPGSPCIYYGSEIPMKGMKGHGKENHRSCMTFKHQKGDFYQFMKTLIHFRHNNDVLKTTETNWLDVNSKVVLMYRRGDIIILMNVSSKKTTIDAPNTIKGKEFFEVFTGKNMRISKRLELESYEFLVLKHSD